MPSSPRGLSLAFHQRNRPFPFWHCWLRLRPSPCQTHPQTCFFVRSTHHTFVRRSGWCCRSGCAGPGGRCRNTVRWAGNPPLLPEPGSPQPVREPGRAGQCCLGLPLARAYQDCARQNTRFPPLPALPPEPPKASRRALWMRWLPELRHAGRPLFWRPRRVWLGVVRPPGWRALRIWRGGGRFLRAVWQPPQRQPFPF